jgi:uncharacterized protein
VRRIRFLRPVPLLLAASLALAGCTDPSPDAAGDELATLGSFQPDDGTDDGAGEEDGEDHGVEADDRAERVLDEVPPLHPSVDDYPEAWVTITRADGGPIELPVRVADTGSRRAHGLMEVPHLPAGTGMLFTFDRDRTGGFWMKDTLVPLDIAFVDDGDEIVAILAMEPCETDPCEVYKPEVTYRSALEVPQGWFAAQRIAVGDRLTYEAIDGR